PESLIISNYGDKLKVDSEKLFKRFYSSNTSGQSLGLGLSLVKRICDLNQLKIEYAYAEGQHFFSVNPK
ncbi:MAG: sensor histidine kinase, partial [Bacteroidales bacterium]